MSTSALLAKTALSLVQIYNARQATKGKSDAEMEQIQAMLETRNHALEDEALAISQDIIDNEESSSG